MVPKEPISAPGDISDDERKRKETSGMAALVTNIVNEQKEAWQNEIKDELEAFRKPMPVNADVLDCGPGDAAIKTSAPSDRLYARMTDEERQWRNPDSDHYLAEFLRGQAYQNHGQKMNAIEKLEGMFGRTALAEGAAGASGAFAAGSGELLPRPLENIVLIARDRVSKMRRWAQVINMTAQTHTIPTAAAMTAYMVAEASTATDGNPTIASVQISANKGQVTALASNEILADSAVNLINMWATRGGGALGVLEDDQFFKEGDGTPPNISAFLSGTSYSEKTSAEFKFYDVNAMYYSVGQQYRQNAVWLIAANVLQLLSQLQDASADKQFYLGLTDLPGPITDDPTAEGTLFRRPVYEVPFTNGTVWFGDPTAAYIIGQRGGLTSAVSDQVKFAEDQVMWKLTQRFDGINIDAAASQVCTGITSVTRVVV